MATRIKNGFIAIEYYPILLITAKDNPDKDSIIKWIDTNCCGRYHVGIIRATLRCSMITYRFELVDDAVAFKLRWFS